MAYAANLRGWGKGWPTNRSADMATVRAARSGAKFTVHKDIAPIIKYLIDEVERRGYLIDHGPGDVDDDWSYANRAIRGKNTPSNHSWGLAIDINAQDFPLGSSKRLPQWIVDLFTDMHFEYGGDWSGRKDPMHFEFAGSRSQAQWIVASLAGHVVNNTKPPVPPSVPPPTPGPTAADLLFIQQLIEEEETDMIVIRNGKGICHIVNNRSVGLNTVQLAAVRKAYKAANKPLVELQLDTDSLWRWYTGLD
jgi:hypothetical protein